MEKALGVKLQYLKQKFSNNNVSTTSLNDTHKRLSAFMEIYIWGIKNKRGKYEQFKFTFLKKLEKCKTVFFLSLIRKIEKSMHELMDMLQIFKIWKNKGANQ